MKILKKGGSLRFWGAWFGRPNDNFHTPISAEFDGSVLTICFSNGERLTVYEPSGIVNEPFDFRIESAEKIVWEWYYYGEEHIPDNLCRWELVLVYNTISVKCSGISQAGAVNADPREYALHMC